MNRPIRCHRVLLWLGFVLLALGSGPAAVIAAPGLAVVITWVGNLSPNGLAVQTITPPNTLYVTVEVYSPGITQNPGPGLGIVCWLHYGQVASFGGPWSNITDIPMAYAGDAGFNDRYGVFLGSLSPGQYEYTAWCSGDGGVTPVWSDNAATGGNGKLIVVAPPPATLTPTATPTPTPSSSTTPQPAGCRDLIQNGGFEQDMGWQFGQTARPPAYVGAPNPIKSGLRSIRLGIVTPTADANSFSSIQQTVMIPAAAQTASIRFSYYPISQAAAGGQDRQELVLLDPTSGATLAVLWRVTENDQKWKTVQLDLTPYRGRPVTVYFNAQNNGDGNRTAMFLDDVNLEACSSFGPTPGPPAWPTPQPPPVYPTFLPPVYPTFLPPVYPTFLPPVYPTLLPLAPALPTFPAVLATPAAAAAAVISPGPPTVVTVEGLGVVPTAVLMTPVPFPTPVPTPTGSPFGEIVGSIGPWAVLCLLGIIVIVSLALLAQWWASRRART